MSETPSGQKYTELPESQSEDKQLTAVTTTLISQHAGGWLPPNYNPAMPLWKHKRLCEFCGKEIIPAKSQEARKRFCDQSCSAKWRATTEEGKRNVIKARASVKNPYLPPHNINPGSLWRQPRPCEYCRKIITPHYPQEARKRFCNQSCAAKWKMTQPEFYAKIHNPEMNAKRGQGRRKYFLSGSPESKAELERMRIMGKETHSPEIHAKMSAKLKEMGHRPPHGGNGNDLTLPQQILLDILGSDWIAEYSLSLGKRMSGYPTNYKLDLANPKLHINIEVDGGSHRGLKRKIEDVKRDAKLASLGWIVLRFLNQDILNWKNTGMPLDGYISTTLQQHSILPTR
jgi:hypothetical protein